MDPMTLAALMAAGGLAKSKFVDEPAQQKRALYEAQKTLYSPWTRMAPGEAVPAESPLNETFNFGLQGLALGQNLQAAKEQAALNKAKADWYNSQTITTPGTMLPAQQQQQPPQELAGRLPPVYERGPASLQSQKKKVQPQVSIWV